MITFLSFSFGILIGALIGIIGGVFITLKVLGEPDPDERNGR